MTDVSDNLHDFIRFSTWVSRMNMGILFLQYPVSYMYMYPCVYLYTRIILYIYICVDKQKPWMFQLSCGPCTKQNGQVYTYALSHRPDTLRVFRSEELVVGIHMHIHWWSFKDLYLSRVYIYNMFRRMYSLYIHKYI